MIDLQELEERIFRIRHRQAFKPLPPPPPKGPKLKHFMFGDWRISAVNKREARKQLRQSLGRDFPTGAPVVEVVRIKGEWVPRQR